MLITQPLPEEFAAGHLGRVLRLNGLRYPRGASLKASDIAESPGGGDTPASPVHALSQLAGTTAVSYARDHTLLPFEGFAFRRDKAGHYSQWSDVDYRRRGPQTSYPHAALCPECVAEDEASLGFSYWRRGHQVDGMRRCTRHDAALRLTERPDAFAHTPRTMLDGTHAFPTAECSALASEALTRYHATVGLMLERGAPESLASMRVNLTDKAITEGLSLGSGSTQNPLLSDRVFEVFPRDWLYAVFPETRAKQPGQELGIFDHTIKRVSHCQLSAPALTVVICALFEDPAQAMDAIYAEARLPPMAANAPPATPKRRTRSPKKQRGPSHHACKPDGWNKLAQAYLEHQGDIDAIAAALGSTVEKVRWRMTTQRTKVVVALSTTEEYRALKTFLAGRSLAETSESHNIPVGTLEALLRLVHRKVRLPDPLPYACSD